MSETTDTDPVCLCGDLIEEVEASAAYAFWAHVKRMTVDFDHSAVPARPDVRIAEAVAQ